MDNHVDIDKLAGQDLNTSIRILRVGFLGLPEQQNGQELVRDYRAKIERILEKLDQGMIRFIQKQDPDSLSFWAARVDLGIQKIHTLDKNLASIGQPQWSWTEVLSAMAFLEAIKQQAEIILANAGE